MNERNSESTLTKVFAYGSVVVGALTALAAYLAETPLVDQWPALGAVVGVVLAIGKVVGEYTKSRPGKHLAMAEREKAAADLEEAKALVARTTGGNPQ